MSEACGFAAYLRVSSALQGDSGLGLEAQERAVRASAALRGVEVVEVITEVVSGAARRLPLRDAALARCRDGELDGLIVAKLDRLARNASGLLRIAEEAERGGFRVLVADPQLVLPGESASDRMFIGMLAVFAEFERGLLAERTKAALAEAKARGTQVGRPPKVPVEVLQLMSDLADQGMGPSMIARELESRRIPTAGGNPWRHSSVKACMRRYSR